MDSTFKKYNIGIEYWISKILILFGRRSENTIKYVTWSLKLYCIALFKTCRMHNWKQIGKKDLTCILFILEEANWYRFSMRKIFLLWECTTILCLDFESRNPVSEINNVLLEMETRSHSYYLSGFCFSDSRVFSYFIFRIDCDITLTSVL